MKKALFLVGYLFTFVCSISCVSGQCSPTLMEIYNFQVGDVFYYQEAFAGGAPQDHGLRYTQKKVDEILKAGDTLRIIFLEGNFKDTLILIDSVDHPLNQCDTAMYDTRIFREQETFLITRDSLPMYQKVVREFDSTTGLWTKRVGDENDPLFSFFRPDSLGRYQPYVDELGSFQIRFAAGLGAVKWTDAFFEGYTRNTMYLKMNANDTLFYQHVGISEHPQVNVAVYPNPTRDYLNIQYLPDRQPVEYRIYTMLGELLQRGIAVDCIDVRQLDQGMYLLQLSSNNLMSIHSFVRDSP